MVAYLLIRLILSRVDSVLSRVCPANEELIVDLIETEDGKLVVLATRDVEKKRTRQAGPSEETAQEQAAPE